MSSFVPRPTPRARNTDRLAERILALVEDGPTIETALKSVLREVVEATGFRIGQAWVPVGSALELRTAWIADPQLQPFVDSSRAIVFAHGEGLPGKAWLARQVLFVNDMSNEAMFYRTQAASDAGLHSALAVPVLNIEGVVAVLEFLAADASEIDATTANLLRDAVSPLAALFRRERERVRNESEAVTRRLFESPMIGIVFWERGGRLVDANDAFLQMLGYTKEELDTKQISWERLSPEEERLDEWVFRQIETSGVCPPFERDCIRKDGRRLTVLMGGSTGPGSGLAVSYILDVSERRRVLDALRESEERFRAFMDNSPAVAFMKDGNGTHVYHNDLWGRLIGYSIEESIGHTDYDLFPVEIADALRRHDQAVLDAGQPIAFWERVPTADGVVRDWLAFKFPFEPTPGRRLLGGMAVDMTDRKRAEAALHASEERYRSLVEHSPDAIFLHSEGRITFINEAGARLLKATGPEAIVGRSIFEIVHPDSHALVRERLSLLEAGQVTPPAEQKWSRADGSFVEVEVFATPSPDTPHGIQVVARDITERKEAERERSRLLALEQAARSESQALSRRLVEAQEQERRRIARELHDEVGQILTGLSLMLKGGPTPPPEPWKKRADEIQGILHDLMRRVREMSLDLRPAMLDDLGLLAALIWHFERYSSQTSIKVHFHHFGLDRRFPADLETAAYRIIQEALTNTARYANTNEVDVHIRARADVLWLRVTDRGSGFAADQAGRGRSMGLAGMRERVAAVGGRLRVDSAPNQGTFLTAWLPLETAPAREEP